MTELTPCPQSAWEREYYEDLSDSYGGVIYDSRSLQSNNGVDVGDVTINNSTGAAAAIVSPTFEITTAAATAMKDVIGAGFIPFAR